MQNLGLVAILNVFGLTELGSLSVIKGSIQRQITAPHIHRAWVPRNGFIGVV